MPEGKQPYFITTPIYYVNAKPHLGTAYCSLLCDVQARFRRAAGYDVLFLTGMDEHGEKVAQAAAEHGMKPQAWCDSQAPYFKDLWDELEVSYDDFIRTTEPRQYRAVQYLWERMRDSGYIYKGSYDGWYCVHEETYFTETQVEKADEEQGTKGQHLCPDCHRPLERVTEESWFFKLSEFQDRLLKLYEEHPEFVEPDFRLNEVRSFVESGLQDVSVSRTSFDWGIPVPFDEGHVTYVWFDALLNYYTAVGYGDDSPEAAALRARFWPAQMHVVGKDIIRFHCVIWPAMLMALGESVPERVFAHGFLNVRNSETGAIEKMSKSMFNVVNPDDIVEQYGADTLRLYEMFLGPVEASKPWDTNGIDGCFRFLKKFWSLFWGRATEDKLVVDDAQPTKESLKTVHKLIKKVTEDIEKFSYNTAVSAFMIAVNEMGQQQCHNVELLQKMIVVLAPFAPHVAEELWHVLGNEGSVCDASWPNYDEKYLVESEIQLTISFNGKARYQKTFAADADNATIESEVRADERSLKYIDGKQIVKVIIVPKKIVNIVIK